MRCSGDQLCSRVPGGLGGHDDRRAADDPDSDRLTRGTAESVTSVTPQELERVWDNALADAGRTLEVAWADQQSQLTRGLCQLLQLALPWPAAFPQFTGGIQALPIGDNPRHGFATLLPCTPAPTRIAIGFLLATGKGMPLDLRAKFAAFSDDKARADFLVVLWPTAKIHQNLITALPAKSREVWDEFAPLYAASLRAIEQTTLRKIRAIPLFLEQSRVQDLSQSCQSRQTGPRYDEPG